jgi:hypothetical protein
MSQFELDERTRTVLDRVRHSTATLSVYDMPADLAEAAVWEIGKILLEDRHLPLVQYNTCRWYLREVSKLLRTKTGWGLALELEICLRKWAAYQLEPELLQPLLCECCDRIGAMTPEEVEEGGDSTTKTQRHEEARGEETAKDAKNAKVRTRTSADDADSADCVSVPGTNNDERCTKNVPTTAGAGNG